jgi:hypothetical protein
MHPKVVENDMRLLQDFQQVREHSSSRKPTRDLRRKKPS